MLPPRLVFSRRVRTTPFTSRIQAGGMQMATVYNHMVLPSTFRGLAEDYDHLCAHVQVWDVSVERQVALKGPDAAKLVQLMTPRNLGKAKPNQCFYVPLVDEFGMMINDPIAINVAADHWWLSIADSDVMLWAKGIAYAKGLNVEISEAQIWPVAIQGPKADELLARVLGDEVRDIRFFRYKRLAYQGREWIVARSGWSKKGGFEVYVDDAAAGQAFWDELFAKGEDLNVGHGCPNQVERMESCLLSFGSDMDYQTSPLQIGLDKYCHLDEDIDSMSLPALRQQREEGLPWMLVGLRCDSGVQNFASTDVAHNGETVGELRSQVWHHKFNCWLGFASLPTALCEPGTKVEIEGAICEVHALPFSFDG